MRNGRINMKKKKCRRREGNVEMEEGNKTMVNTGKEKVKADE